MVGGAGRCFSREDEGQICTRKALAWVGAQWGGEGRRQAWKRPPSQGLRGDAGMKVQSQADG